MSLARRMRRHELENFLRGHLKEVAAQRFDPHTLKDFEAGGAPVRAPLLDDGVKEPRRMHDGNTPRPDLAESTLGSQAGEDQLNTFGALLKTSAHTGVGLRTEGVAAARVPEEDRSWFHSQEATDGVINGRSRYEPRAGFGDNARRMK